MVENSIKRGLSGIKHRFESRSLNLVSISSNVILGFVLILLIILFSNTSAYFLTFKNWMDIGRSIAIIGIAGLGETVCIVSGGLDLSIAATMAAAGLLAARLLRLGVPALPTVLIVLMFGAIVGTINGFLISKLKINSFITTLAMMSIIRGVGYIFSEGKSELIPNETFRSIGRGYLPLTQIPIPVLLFLLVGFFSYLLLSRTEFGRYVYAIGGNETATRLAGIDVDRWKILVYIYCATLCAFAGIVLSATAGSSFPNAALGREMDVIAGVILGGTSLYGGEGTILGTVMGVLILGTLSNGMILMNIDAYWQQVVKGVILLLAVLIDVWRRRKT
jgi:ribose/xylose/arabinose/galactoside ABC-type transport system permease subunit